MKTHSDKHISKFMSLVLRHQPEKIGLDLDEQGWVPIDLFLQKMRSQFPELELQDIQRVVAESDKQRFAIEGNMIRANQGHSIQVELGLEPCAPPKILYHGTATRNLDAIAKKGLLKMKRHHVHLSENQETAVKVGSRYGKPVVLRIDAARMHQDGHEFRVTKNRVWLVDRVPPEYFERSE